MPHMTGFPTVAGARIRLCEAVREAGHAPFDEPTEAFLAAFLDSVAPT